MWINRWNILLYPHYCVSRIKCASHFYCTQRERWRTAEKCGGTISIRWPCNVSSFATVSPAHVRFTEHGSMPSRLLARRLLARRVREWRMRWHLHVSVCSLMTQRSFLPHRPPLSPLAVFTLFISDVLRTPRLPISRAAHPPRVLSQSYSPPRKLLCTSGFLCGFAKKDTFNFNYLGKLSKAGSVYFARKYYFKPQAARHAV